MHVQPAIRGLAWVSGVAGAQTHSPAVAGELAILMLAAPSQQLQASRTGASAQHQEIKFVTDASSANFALGKWENIALGAAAASTCMTTIAGTTAAPQTYPSELYHTTQGTMAGSAVPRSHAQIG